jgi:hypothetical protein
MAAVVSAQAVPKITFRDLDPEDLKKENVTKIALGALALLLLVASAVGYYFLLKHKPGVAAKIDARFIIPVMTSLAGVIAGVVAPFIDFEKSSLGSTSQVKNNEALREEVRDYLLNKTLDLVHKKLVEEKNGGIGADRHVNALGNDENREKASKILKLWPKAKSTEEKAQLNEYWKKLQAHVRGEEPKAPADPEVAVVPQVPADPEVAVVPQVPADPEVAEVPQAPADPEVAEVPQVPADPEVAEVPQAPARPEVTEQPAA